VVHAKIMEATLGDYGGQTSATPFGQELPTVWELLRFRAELWAWSFNASRQPRQSPRRPQRRYISTRPLRAWLRQWPRRRRFRPRSRPLSSDLSFRALLDEASGVDRITQWAFTRPVAWRPNHSPPAREGPTLSRRLRFLLASSRLFLIRLIQQPAISWPKPE